MVSPDSARLPAIFGTLRPTAASIAPYAKGTGDLFSVVRRSPCSSSSDADRDHDGDGKPACFSRVTYSSDRLACLAWVPGS
ncbi:hypothetical protein L1887_43979 [Cichorium endivia]|nr:hypothetical protein L1887_43979 [Cichorium endivia]